MGMKHNKSSVYKRIYELVRRIPTGKVATYGQIAHLVDKCNARMVGYAMASLPFDTDVPWHRVVNRKGEISIRVGGQYSHEQHALLTHEGITFNAQKKIDLSKYRWLGEQETI